MDNKITIGFDMDGVILDHSRTKVIAAKKFGFDLKKKDTPTEIIKTILPLDTYEEFKESLYRNFRLLSSATLNPGIHKLLNRFKKKNIRFVLISRQRDPRIVIKLLKIHKLWPEYFNKKNTLKLAGN